MSLDPKLPPALRETAAVLETITFRAAEAVQKEQELHSWSVKIKNTLSDIWAGTPGSGWLEGEISAAMTLGQKLWDAAAAKAKLSAPLGVDDAGQPIQPGVSKDQRPEARPMDLGDDEPKGGGGSKANSLAEKLKSLQEDFMTEQELLQAQYDQRLLTLKEARAKELLTEQEYQDLKEKAQDDHNKRLAAMDAYRYGDGLQQASAFFGDMATAMQSGNEKTQKIAQKFAAAEALINAWRAYAQVIADPTLPWYAKVPKAMAVLSSAMGAVKSIKSASSGSTSSATSTSGSSSGSTQDTYQPTSVNIAWQGDVTAASLGSLTEKLNREYKRGYRLTFTVGA